MTENIEHEDLMSALRDEVSRHGGVVRWAEAKRVSASLVCITLSGSRQIGETIARALGYEIARVYRKKKTET